MGHIMSREDYIEVAERVQLFYEKYPQGSLQGEWEWLTDDHTVIVYTAYAYRDRDDNRPGIGHASEPYPGLSNFTRNSEMQNAHTSSWGRAIASLGIAVHRGIASAQEVRAAQRGTDVPQVTRVKVTEDDNGWYGPLTDTTSQVDQGPTDKQMTYARKEPATDKQLKLMISKLQAMGLTTPTAILEYVNSVLSDNKLEPVAGSTEMTKYAASKVIDTLMKSTPP
jgi:hypothetical protein